MADALDAVATVKPFTSRLEPVQLEGNITLLRDEKDGQVDTFDAAFKAMQEASAQRKLVVIGDCSDLKGKPRQRLRYLAEKAASFADIVIFIGEYSHHGVRYAKTFGMGEEAAHSFTDLRTAAEFLRTQLMSGDLVLVKGKNSHRLGRLFFLLKGSIACGLYTCRLKGACDTCPKLQFTPEESYNANGHQYTLAPEG